MVPGLISSHITRMYDPPDPKEEKLLVRPTGMSIQAKDATIPVTRGQIKSDEQAGAPLYAQLGHHISEALLPCMG